MSSIILINSTVSAKTHHFLTCHNSAHINCSNSFHYPNQHDLPKWTLVHSTIEIGHRILDPPAPNRKSVLIPIAKIRISTLSITYKCHYNAVCRLFFCAFKDSNALHMRRLRELIDWLNRFCHMVPLFRKTLDITN